MNGQKQIMYGVTDFALMRTGNAYFVDRTDLIRELEKTRYTVFLRPRRFGKSLLVSILQCYYDVDYAHRFDELFGGLKIAENPTDERGKFLALCLNFSGFNIGANVSLDPTLAELTGFTEVDLREMLEYYRENEFDFDVESVLRQMEDWYDHYVFARGTKNDGTPVKSVASPILVLAYILYFVRNHAVPDDLVDKNLRTASAKIRHVITESRKLNGNYHKLEDIIAEVEEKVKRLRFDKRLSIRTALVYDGKLAASVPADRYFVVGHSMPPMPRSGVE